MAAMGSCKKSTKAVYGMMIVAGCNYIARWQLVNEVDNHLLVEENVYDGCGYTVEQQPVNKKWVYSGGDGGLVDF